MVTAHVATGEIDLPNVGTAPGTPKQPYEITVKQDGSLWLRDLKNPNVKERELSGEAIAAEIVAAQQTNPKQIVVIAGDKAARYEYVVHALDVLQRHGVRNVSLLVQPNAGSPQSKR
jgi:biopolymer transport protein TolR